MPRKSLLETATLLLGSSLIAGTAWAQAAPTVDVDMEYLTVSFEAADQDGDGLVCEGELVSDMAAQFAAADINNDDKLERSEVEDMNAEAFDNLDTNDDDAVSFMEVAEPRMKLAEEMDPDGSGCWTFEEYVSETQKLCAQLAAGETVRNGPFVVEGEDVRCLNGG